MGEHFPNSHPASYELTFSDEADTDTVVVLRTERTGAGGHPVYADETGIVMAEISDKGEVRMLASGGQQSLTQPVARSRRPGPGAAGD
ncbi:MAG: hypothetical protein QOI83_3285 [Streptomycetaceae bacterium]|jgi:hypothetical protein|nr:hypothetical protein [Streptomycetaceae bacterium]